MDGEPRKSVKSIFAGARWGRIAAVITALGTVAGIAKIATDLLPGSTPCPPDKATLRMPTIDAGKLRRFLTLISPPVQDDDYDPTEGYTQAALNSRVTWLSAPVDVQGYRGEALTLTWSIGETESVAAVTLTSDDCASREIEHLLVDPPIPAGHTRLVRIQLQNELGQTLAQAPTVHLKG